MTPRRRNDRQRPHGRPRAAPWRPDAAGAWLWGWHTVLAALENPARSGTGRLFASPDRARALKDVASLGDIKVEVAETAAIGALLPHGAVHQGVAFDTPLIEPTALDDLAHPAAGVLLMLDQLTDPQNIGAMFRSAAAFGARGVILQDRHAPPLAGALAKVAAGAIDRLPHARETNLSRALERLDGLGWRAVGLDGEAEAALADVLGGGPTVLVIGSEGEGLRRLVREHCDALARIPMPGDFESLNASAAAAVALYEASRAAHR